MNTIKYIGILLILFWQALPASVYAAEPYSEKTERDFQISGRPMLIVHNPDGHTVIHKGTGSAVHVEAIKEVFHASDEAGAKKAADRVELVFNAVGNRIEVEAKHPHYTFNFGFRRPEVRVTFRITAPHESDITASAADGELDVQGFDGQMQLSVADGDLTIADLSGDLKITAADGNIQSNRCSGTVEFRVADGNITADASSGNITGYASDGSVVLTKVNGEVNARTVDGKIRVDGLLKSLNAKASDGKMEINVNSGSIMEKDWSLKSSDGDIVLRLPEDFSADLDVSTADGHIETRKAINVIGSVSRSRLTGKISHGGRLLEIHTSDGDVEILDQ